MIRQPVDGVYELTYLSVPHRRYRVYLIEDEVPTVIDTGYEETADAVLEAIDETGLVPERLIITHAHADHAGAFDALVDAYDMETWAPSLSIDSIGEKHSPDYGYDDGDTIGGFTAVHVPGHTPDTFALVDETAGRAVLGDTVFGSDLRGLPAGYLLPPPHLYNDDPYAAEENLERLIEFSFDVGLVFHGSSVTENASQKLARFVDFPEKEPGMPEP